MSVRAEIIDTGVDFLFKAQLVIDKPAAEIFEFIAKPANHPLIDGSGMVKGKVKGPEQLYLGAKFRMKMRLGIPYLITNQVIEFKTDNLIAWQHLLKNVWRYELQAIDKNSTLVIESWDGRNAISKWWVSDAHTWVPKAMAKSLVNLKNLVENVKAN